MQELPAAGWVLPYKLGRKRQVGIGLLTSQTWSEASPALRTPVKRTGRAAVSDNDDHRIGWVAGLRALAHSTMMTALKCPTVAILGTDWKAVIDAGVQALDRPQAGAQAQQLWHHSPALVLDTVMVDLMSLMSSLHDITDQGALVALDQLKERPQWRGNDGLTVLFSLFQSDVAAFLRVGKSRRCDECRAGIGSYHRVYTRNFHLCGHKSTISLL